MNKNFFVYKSDNTRTGKWTFTVRQDENLILKSFFKKHLVNFKFQSKSQNFANPTLPKIFFHIKWKASKNSKNRNENKDFAFFFGNKKEVHTWNIKITLSTKTKNITVQNQRNLNLIHMPR